MKVQLPKNKYDVIKTKEEMVETMKNPVISALNFTIDQLVESINLAGGDPVEQKEDDSPVVQQYRSSLDTYQSVLNKVKNDEELTPLDYDLITLVCKNTSILMSNQIDALREAAKELNIISWKLAHLKLGTDKVKEAIELSKNLTEDKS